MLFSFNLSITPLRISLYSFLEYRIKNCTDDETFKISDREFKTIEDIINYHIDNTVKWKRDGALLA